MAEIIKIMEIIGTVAFAISGALVAVSSRMDIFGVIFVGCITAFGGGIIRDLLLGATPPAIFFNTSIFLVGFVTCILVFVIAYINRRKFDAFKEKIDTINNVFDAIGLAAFSVIGSEAGYMHGYSSWFIIIIVGMITGIGGGILRDVLIDKTPYVFKKHVYAVASILGSALYFLLRKYVDSSMLVTVLPLVLVFTIRMLATRFRWSLPKIDISEESKV